MKRFIASGFILALVLASASFVQAAHDKGAMQLKVGDELYVCGCGPECPCLTMAAKAGRCPCGKELVKAQVTKVSGDKAAVRMPDGKEQAFPLKGKYVCACGPKCNCHTISQGPGKCVCGADMKPHGPAKVN